MEKIRGLNCKICRYDEHITPLREVLTSLTFFAGFFMAARHIVVIVIASVFSALAVIGIAFVWTKMRSRRHNLHDGL
jgi:hypothetical protein